MRTSHALTLSSLLLALSSHHAYAAGIAAQEWAAARQTPVGATHTFDRVPLGLNSEGKVRMKRIEVYAPDARILVPQADGKGFDEVPRSDWVHFVADASATGEKDPAAPRLSLSFSPDGLESRGVLIAGDGGTYAVTGATEDGELRLSAYSTSTDARGNSNQFICQNNNTDLKDPRNLPPLVIDAEQLRAVVGASRSAVVAVDTDNEFMQQKFSNNTTNATNYLAQLYAGLNVIYQRDLDLSILQGTTLLRVSSVPDPFTAPPSFDNGDQLDEFGEVWFATQAATNRAFSMFLSGKSASANSSSGLAWLLGNVNYCNQKGSTFPSSFCTDGTCTFGHYSVSNVFKFAGADAADDLLVVAHELGHNFGANHTHCSDAGTGAGPTSGNTIDLCFNGEADQGCYAGNTVCPAPTTVNGLPDVTGTLMSYCHLGGSNGVGNCESSEVFANAHRTLINPRVANNVTLGCFSSTSAINQAPTLNAINNPAAVFEDAAQQTINLSGIGDGDGGTQTITVTASSNNTGLIPNPSVTYTSPSSTGSIRYTPVANQSGSAVVTVTVTDNGGTAGGGVNSFSRNFTVNVAAVNDPPTLNSITPPAAIPVNSGQRTINLSGISAGPNESQTLTVTAVSNNTGLIPNPSVSYSSPSATGSISYTPVAGQSGSALITVTVSDNGGTANGGVNQLQRSFTQTVTAGALFANGFED